VAVVTSQQVVVPHFEGNIDRFALVGLKNVTTGDTVDLGAGGAYPLFSGVERAVAIGLTVVGSAVVSNTGNVLTVPAGIAGDAVVVLVYGSAL
jgi:hypothetical protein